MWLVIIIIIMEKGYQASESPKNLHEEEHATSARSYISRYYVLTVFSLLAAHQNTTWMTFGTIPQESYDSFGLSDDGITLLAGK